MAYPRWLAHEIIGIARGNAFWMVWNLILAFLPALLALGLFFRPHRRTLLWWAGVGAFVLLLPNAPYVVTDIIHLREDAAEAASDGVLVFGVLPMYALFVLAGFLSYVLCVEGVVREVHQLRPKLHRVIIELPVHALASLGIVLGRITRLNSWDTVTHPRWTTERIFNTLTWRGAPFVFLAIFVAVVVTYTLVRLLVLAVVGLGERIVRRVRPQPAPLAPPSA